MNGRVACLSEPDEGFILSELWSFEGGWRTSDSSGERAEHLLGRLADCNDNLNGIQRGFCDVLGVNRDQDGALQQLRDRGFRRRP